MSFHYWIILHRESLVSLLLIDYVDQRLAVDETADVFLDSADHPGAS